MIQSLNEIKGGMDNLNPQIHTFLSPVMSVFWASKILPRDILKGIIIGGYKYFCLFCSLEEVPRDKKECIREKGKVSPHYHSLGVVSIVKSLCHSI